MTDDTSTRTQHDDALDATGGPAASPVTAADVLERFGGDAEMVQQLADIFLEEVPRQLADVRAAIDAADAPELRRTAHKLKGSVGTFAEGAAYETSLRLEFMGRDSDLGDGDAAWAALASAVQDLERVLTSLAGPAADASNAA